ENHLAGKDISSTQYNFSGNISRAKLTHSSSYGSLTVEEEYDYDHSGRLLILKHSINSNTPVIMVSNRYNELGEVIEKNIHSTDNGSTFLQSIDRRYNIQGWLTSINNSKLTSDGTLNDDNSDLFGMEIVYNQSIPI